MSYNFSAYFLDFLNQNFSNFRIFLTVTINIGRRRLLISPIQENNIGFSR